MVTILGYPVRLPPGLESLGGALASFLLTLVAWALIALAVYLLVNYPLHWGARRVRGDVADTVVEILRRPAVLVTAAYGVVGSLRAFPLSQATVGLLGRLFYTVLTIAIIYVLWRITKDILVYYGSAWAARTESRVDDVLIPILNLFGPVLILLVAGLVLLPLWGIDIASVLLGAGILGLVLGLALQDTLSNFFSGLSLLVEAPFRTKDLVALPDGKLCEVVRIGLRSTELYSLDEHSTVYVPNKILSSSAIVNITKPTFEQKVSIDVSLGPDGDLAQTQELLKQIALAHPNVLTADSDRRIPLIHGWARRLRRRAKALDEDDLWREDLLEQAARYEQAIAKLRLEAALNGELLALRSAQQELIETLARREDGGFSSEELKELHNCCVANIETQLARVTASAEAWSAVPDPWATAQEAQAEQLLWHERNERLLIRWQDLKADLARPWRTEEMRLDDVARAFLDWLAAEYKLLPEAWKNPVATVKAFDGRNVQLQLWFYIDNIRMEHFNRSRRVTTEIAREVRELLAHLNS